jgi:hypothetical protein
MRLIRVTTLTFALSTTCLATPAGNTQADQSPDARVSIIEVTPGKLSDLDYQVKSERPRTIELDRSLPGWKHVEMAIHSSPHRLGVQPIRG